MCGCFLFHTSFPLSVVFPNVFLFSFWIFNCVLLLVVWSIFQFCCSCSSFLVLVLFNASVCFAFFRSLVLIPSAAFRSVCHVFLSVSTCDVIQHPDLIQHCPAVGLCPFPLCAGKRAGLMLNEVHVRELNYSLWLHPLFHWAASALTSITMCKYPNSVPLCPLCDAYCARLCVQRRISVTEGQVPKDELILPVLL